MKSTEAKTTSLTKHQQEAVAHTNGPLLVLAGPGSGKTTIAKKFNKNIVGFDIKPEFPKNPDIVITNDFSKSIDYLSNKIFQNLKNKYKRQV